MKLSQVQNIIVTGGTGFIGSYLVEVLLESFKGKITIIDNNFSNDVLPLNLKNKVDIRITDIRNLDEVEIIFKELKPEACFHLAAIHFIPYCIEHPNEAIDVNIKGTSNIQYLCSKYSVNILQASSAAVYSPYSEPHKETSEVKPADIYGYTKKVNEDTLEFYFKEKSDELFAVSARIFNAYGSRDTIPHVLTEIIGQIKNQEDEDKVVLELGNIKPKRDFIHGYDLARAMISIVESTDSGLFTYNIGTGESWSIEQIVNKISKIIQKEIEIVTSQERYRKSDRMFLEADISQIMKNTGWKPQITIDSGLRLFFE